MLMKQMTVDRSLKKLSIETLTMKIGRAESPLASFLFVLSFYGESLGGHGFVTVLSTIALQHRWIELMESYLLILKH